MRGRRLAGWVLFAMLQVGCGGAARQGTTTPAPVPNETTNGASEDAEDLDSEATVDESSSVDTDDQGNDGNAIDDGDESDESDDVDDGDDGDDGDSYDGDE